MSGSLDPNPGRATMAYKEGPNGIPIFRRSWLISDAPIRKTRVLENKAGDSRLWDPTDTEFWSMCQHVVPPQDVFDTVPRGWIKVSAMSIGTIK